MPDLFELAGRTLGGAYTLYMGAMGLAGIYGIHLIVLAVVALLSWRGRFNGAIGLDVVYGFVNPLIYLLVFEPYGVFREHRAMDAWLAALAWTLFVTMWGARLVLPRQLERSPETRARLSRLCVLGLLTLGVFALNDLLRVWLPGVSGPRALGSTFLGAVWPLAALGPLYVIPGILLNRYRARLRGAAPEPGLLLLSRPVAFRFVMTLAILGLVVTLAATLSRPSDAASRERVGQLAPVISGVADRYRIDPRLLAAIVYVTEREQHEPFRDQLERMAMTTFLVDAESHFHLARRFDFSIGIAQVKPTTALTALKVCKELGEPWELWYKHLRDVPPLGPEWQLADAARGACRPPATPVPINKPQVVAALMRDEENVAFAGLILALYQEQWRSVRSEWDISSRPDVLATLYQIGFERSKPHGAPRSNAFGQRVASVAGEQWLRARFDVPRIARE